MIFVSDEISELSSRVCMNVWFNACKNTFVI